MLSMMSRKCHFGEAISKGQSKVVRAWIEKDVYIWRVKAMLGHPPNWRLNMSAGPRSAGRPLDRLDLRYAAD